MVETKGRKTVLCTSLSLNPKPKNHSFQNAAEYLDTFFETQPFECYARMSLER